MNPKQCLSRHHLCLLLLVLGPLTAILAQEEKIPKKEAPPALQSNRADENYAHLRDGTKNPYQNVFGDSLKYLAFDSKRSVYLSLGGSYRARVEHFTNQNWTSEEESYYSQRLSFHSDLHLGKHVRVFAELYHGYTSDTVRLFQSDDLDWHQLFVELSLPINKKQQVKLHFGRQEFELGANRLIGTREGTNMRRSFDMAKLRYNLKEYSMQFFYGKEVQVQFEAFDNSFDLFDTDSTNPETWGVYFNIPSKKVAVTDELYYIGFRSKRAGFSDVFGEEMRHTIGLRRVGKIKERMTFNTELLYQFGTLGDHTIRAFNIETDWKFLFTKWKMRPMLGIKLDFSSGDRALADGRIQTFNPLFVNPAIYSLAAVNTPANLSSFHPNITFFPAKGLSIYADYALFFRTSRADGLYAPPRFQARPANGLSDRHIGDALGISIQYIANRNTTLSIMSSYFIPAAFIEASGPSENTFFIAPTASFRF